MGARSHVFLQSCFEESFSQRLAGGTEVTCLATQRRDGASHRLGIGLLGCKIVVVDWDCRGNRLVEIFTKDMGKVAPRALAFTVSERNLYVVGLYGGQW